MRRRAFLAAVIGVGVAVRSRAAEPALPPDTIAIDNFTFAPQVLQVRAGTAVTWLNRDDIPHVVVGQDNPRELKSPPLDTDDHFSFVFKAPGTYRYFCSLHPHMQGSVVVT